MQFPDSDFWNFSIRFYAQAEVETICLDLQNQHQLDINTVLFVFWLAAEKNTVLSTEQWQQLLSVSLPWQEIIKPLRKSRVLLKDATIAWPVNFQHETKDSISQIEINAEHMQQLAMEKSFSNMTIEASSVSADQQIKNNILNLLDACNNNITYEMIKTNIKRLHDVFQADQDNKKIIA